MAGCSYTGNGAVVIGGAATATSDIRLERVAVRDSGGAGISVTKNVQRLEILDSAVMSVGASGIQFEGDETTDVLVNNSFVNDTARVILGQPAGIRVKGQRNMTVSYNTVSFNPYAGIMIGWQHGTLAAQQEQLIFDIAHNHVHDYGMGVLSDFGGIYLSTADNLCFQKDPPLCHLPSYVHHNHIHDCSRYNYGCQGIYM
jgi:hypothetical protein